MKLTLTRTIIKKSCDSIFGKLVIEGAFECETLERLSKCIPEGTYPITFYFSPHNRRTVPLLAVPDRQYIEIHPANWSYQLEGCIAVGLSRNEDSINSSVAAFTELMAIIQDVKESLELTVLSADS